MSGQDPLRALTLGEFATSTELVDATERLRIDGHTSIDTYTPYPVHAAEDAMLLPPSRMPQIALCGAIVGASIGYGFQWWTAAIDYPINVGNRMPHSPQAFLPITFELAVLFGALSIFFGLLFLWKLPRPHHPVFEVEGFRSASSHAFWVSVEAEAGRADEIANLLRGLGALQVTVVAEAHR